MPVVKVWGLPPDISEENIDRLCVTITKTIVDIPELELKRNDIAVFFSPDRMMRGLGEEIVIDICGLFTKRKRNREIRKCLAAQVGITVKKFFPNALVECFVYPFNQSQGFWASNMQ